MGSMSTEFRLLGPVEAVLGDQLASLGAPKQRALLAVMLLNANSVISRDGLIDALWGADPPRSAVQSLQVYVHGLRRAIGADRIETQGTGYELRLNPGELDVDRFEQLVERATRLPPPDAADDLRAALKLWNGAPLGDLGGERVAETEAPRLADRRLYAQERLHDAELALGRHDELLPELERLIVEEPYRERFRAQYVLALYRAGRQKDALDAYRAAREVFVEELGVDPSPELQDLERRILRHDPSLKAPELPDGARVELPVPPTPLLGRRLEVAAVTALLRRDDVRLVTLTGPGGTGKTRLALAAAEELGPELRDGAVFVDLAAVRDPQLLAVAIAHTLGVAESSSSLDDAVGEFLREKRLLLVLDNLEQLLPDVELVARLLAAAPRLLVLATSRSPLRLAGEHAYPVPPLPLPATARDASFEELAANEAVALFVARARAADPAFELNDENARAVADVCGRLDGLPLAIELAAARAKLLHPSSIGGRLDQALELLTGGPRDLPARQRTLRSTLEWSYDLLGENDRTVFARLAVFSGGWTLAAAEAVCSHRGLPVLESLTSLVDGNLVRRLERPGPELRFAMLETIREYSAESLMRSGEAKAVKQRHAEHMLAIAEEANAVILAGSSADEYYTRLDEEQDNLRAAIAWAVESDALELEVRLLVAMRWFWVVRGHLLEGRRFFDDAMTRVAGADMSLRATALAFGATFPFRQGENALAKERWEEALVLFRELDDPDGIGRCIGELGAVAIAEGDLDRAAALYESALPLYREQETKGRLGVALSNLGAIANLRRQPDVAAGYFEEALHLQRLEQADDGVAISLHNLARSLIALDRLDEARATLEESATIARRIGYREVMAYCFGGMAELAMADDDPERAARALGAAENLFSEIGSAMDPDEDETQRRVLSYVIERLGAERVDELRAPEARMSMDELAPPAA
jgi:predicted ATPase/DNA-binding SARP family transcriptional activator